MPKGQWSLLWGWGARGGTCPTIAELSIRSRGWEGEISWKIRWNRKILLLSCCGWNDAWLIRPDLRTLKDVWDRDCMNNS